MACEALFTSKSPPANVESNIQVTHGTGRRKRLVHVWLRMVHLERWSSDRSLSSGDTHKSLTHCEEKTEWTVIHALKNVLRKPA